MSFPISPEVSSVRSLSQVTELLDEAAQMRAQGLPFISLMTGDIYLPSPEEAKAEGIRGIEGNASSYSPVAGFPELRSAIANRVWELHGLEYDRDEILITPGGAQGLFYASMIMRSERPFLIPSPYWWSYIDQIRLAGAKSEVLESDPQSLKLKPETLDAALAKGGGPLILNQPTNPTGVVYSAKELKELAEVIVKHDGYCIADETYSTMVFDGRFSSIVAAHPEMRERTVISDSFSTAFNMTGWRVGYLCGPKPFIEAADKIQSVVALAPASISQRAALGALETPAHKLAADLDVHRNHRDITLEMLEKVDGIKCFTPGAGIFAFPDVTSLYGLSIDGEQISSSAGLCLYLLRKHRILAAPGSMFGSDRHLRLSYSVPTDELKLGLARLVDGLIELQRRGTPRD